MKSRRSVLRTLTAGVVALAVVVGTAIADELLGVMTAVDVEGKKITVVEKDSDKEAILKVGDNAELVTPKGATPVDLEKLAKFVDRAKEKGKKGMMVKVTHENGVVSKIAVAAKKKQANP